MNACLNILLVEDDPVLASQLERFLNHFGHSIDFAATGKEAVLRVQQHNYDVVILDLSLPDMDGIDVCRSIKQNSQVITPILMLTARTALSDKMEGFNAGTDDYVTKPYQPDEVLMRCVALAKRRQLHQKKVIEIGELALDLVSHKVYRAKQELQLSSKDKAILVVLAEAHPMPVAKHVLEEKVWGNDTQNSNVLKSHIYTLRQQLDKPFTFPMLKTIHGVGFGLREQP